MKHPFWLVRPVLLLTCLIAATGAGLAQVPATIPFSDGFEGGSLSQHWAVSTVGPGYAAVFTSHGPKTGQSHLVIASSVDATAAEVEVTVALDLVGQSGLVLGFSHKEFEDEDHPKDGIWVSNDGATWAKIKSLVGADGSSSQGYQGWELDLDAAVASVGLAYSTPFFISLQWQGDSDIPLDGFAFDDFYVLAPPAHSSGFGPGQIISTSADGAYTVFATDLDGDGDADVLSASYWDDKIAWHENQGGGVFGPQQVLTTSAAGAWSVYATDLDGDGDADVLSASTKDAKIAWYENQGGGVFGPQQVITTAGIGASSVYATDLDGDGDADVLFGSPEGLFGTGGQVGWSENLGGGVFGAQQVITTSAAGDSVYAIDLDGDGDADVLSASLVGDKIAWWANNGSGVFGAQQVITTSADAAQSVYATDLDGDGDADVLSASSNDDKIAWYENQGGGVFGPQQVITTSADFAKSVYATDLDGDADADVLSASLLDDKIAWYENQGGGVFGTPQVITTTAEKANSVYATDLDGDGDADVVSAAWAGDYIAWYENLSFLDCNGDGIDDSQAIASGASQDCNTNGIPDECDLASGYSFDIDGDGQLDDCLAPPLMADTYELSVAAGGAQAFTLTAPTAIDLYLLLGSTSGTSPGTPSSGFIVPLNLDSYLLHTAFAPDTPPLSSSFGILTPKSPGPGGQASATFSLPPAFDPGIVGLTLHHAYVTVNLTTGLMNFVSNAVPLALLP